MSAFPRMADHVGGWGTTERREFRRHDLEGRSITVDRLDGGTVSVVNQHSLGQPLGEILDLSASGIRVRTRRADVRVGMQVQVRVELPAFAGISPFIDAKNGDVKPSREWTGWMEITRVKQVGTQHEVAGRLVDMDELDRGMLSLYLSTQPLAA